MKLNLFGGAEIESIFLELLLPNTKPVVVGISYRPPRQSEVLEIIKTHFSKFDTNINKIYISGDFIVNLYLITFLTFIYLITFFKKKFLKSQPIPRDIKKCYESCRIQNSEAINRRVSLVAVQPSLITYQQAHPIEFHSKVSLMLERLITKLYTVL